MGKDLNGVRYSDIINKFCLSWYISDQVKELVTGFPQLNKALKRIERENNAQECNLTLVWVLYVISMSLFLYNQLATYLLNYTDQRIKIPKQGETAFHGGCVEKQLLEPVATQFSFNSVNEVNGLVSTNMLHN